MPTEHVGRHTLIAVVWALVILLFFLVQFPDDRRFTIFFINKGVALSAVILIGISYLLGPLCKVIPFLKHHLRYRKYFGLLGFSALVLHILLSLLQPDRFPLDWYLNHGLGVSLATGAAFMFFLLAITSTKASVHWMGGHNWKLLQRMGYIAYIYALIHMYVAIDGRLRTTTTIALAFGIIVIVARLAALLVDHVKPHSQQ